jgi:hypothetical protein
LAGALDVWSKKSAPLTPVPYNVTFWRNLCADDPLPEIRRAINAYNHA